MDKSGRKGVIPLTGRCSGLMTCCAVLPALYAPLVAPDGLLRLSRP